MPARQIFHFFKIRFKIFKMRRLKADGHFKLLNNLPTSTHFDDLDCF